MVLECNVEAIVMLTKCVEMSRVSHSVVCCLECDLHHRRRVPSTGQSH